MRRCVGYKGCTGRKSTGRICDNCENRQNNPVTSTRRDSVRLDRMAAKDLAKKDQPEIFFF